jgi:hypothetical protein
VRTPYPDAVWHNQRYALLHNPAAFITAVESPNGLETLHGQSRVWIAAARPTVFAIRALQPGRYALGASQVVLGPSAPGEPQRTLEVIDAAGTHHVVLAHRRATIPLTLRAVRSLTNGATRELMPGLQGYFVHSSAAVPSTTTTAP